MLLRNPAVFRLLTTASARRVQVTAPFFQQRPAVAAFSTSSIRASAGDQETPLPKSDASEEPPTLTDKEREAMQNLGDKVKKPANTENVDEKIEGDVSKEEAEKREDTQGSIGRQ